MFVRPPELRKWASNHQGIINHLPEADIENKENYHTMIIGELSSHILHYHINNNMIMNTRSGIRNIGLHRDAERLKTTH